MDKEAIAKLIEHHRLDCMRMIHGQCSTRRCMVRGGWEPGDGSGYSKATCEALETCRALETLEAQLDGHRLTAKNETANLLRAEAAEAEAARLREALERAKKAAQSGLDYDGDRLSDDEALTGACERVVQITSAALGGEHG